MLPLKKNSWWKFLSEVFYIFYCIKVNWIEHNQALCSVNFFTSHFVNISLTTLFNPATGSRLFLCKPRVLMLYWNFMKTEPAEERKSHSSECMAWCFHVLGRATGSCLSYFDSCFIFGVKQITSRLWISNKMKTHFFILGTTVCS